MRARGFTLIEVMVASVIGLLILVGAIALSTAMTRAARQTNELQELTTRGQAARGFLLPLLSSAGVGWTVENAATWPATPTRTGTFGAGSCAVGLAGLCDPRTPATVFPVRVVDGGAAGADEVAVLIPREASIDTLQIKARGDGSALPATCTAADITPTQTFDVEGATTHPWAVGDLVLVFRSGHVTVASVAADLAAGGPGVRDLQLALGSGGPALANDDGGSADPCSAVASLGEARVMRIAQVRFRHASGSLEYAQSVNVAEAGAPVFRRVIGNVDDLQVQLEVLSSPKDATAGTAATCVCNDTTTAAVDTVFKGGRFTAASCGVVSGNPSPLCDSTRGLNKVTAVDTAFRVVGLRVGLVLRGDLVGTAGPATGMFNRTGALPADGRSRQRFNFYVGLPNAYSF